MEPRESNLENPWNLKGKRERVPGGTSDEQVGNKDINNQQPLSLFPLRLHGCVFYFLNSFNHARTWILHCKMLDFAVQNFAVQKERFCNATFCTLLCKILHFPKPPFAHPPFRET